MGVERCDCDSAPPLPDHPVFLPDNPPLPLRLRDYGLPQFADPDGPPRILRPVDEPCRNERCRCPQTFLIEVRVRMPEYNGGYGVGRYAGCCACAWAGPMNVTGVRCADSEPRSMDLQHQARWKFLFTAQRVIWCDRLNEFAPPESANTYRLLQLLYRHQRGDWGLVDREQQAANDLAECARQSGRPRRRRR